MTIKWTAVSDRLPETDMRCVVRLKDFDSEPEYELAMFYIASASHDWYFDTDSFLEPTHWAFCNAP